jgi:hypothetical protein
VRSTSYPWRRKEAQVSRFSLKTSGGDGLSVICPQNHCDGVDDQFLTDLEQPGASGLTSRGVQSDRMSLIFLGKYRSSPILSLNPYFVGNTTPSRGRPPQAYLMTVPWPIEGISIASTKNLSILFCFNLFFPNSLLQPPILFSLHLGCRLRHSRWPC